MLSECPNQKRREKNRTLQILVLDTCEGCPTPVHIVQGSVRATLIAQHLEHSCMGKVRTNLGLACTTSQQPNLWGLSGPAIRREQTFKSPGNKHLGNMSRNGPFSGHTGSFPGVVSSRLLRLFPWIYSLSGPVFPHSAVCRSRWIPSIATLAVLKSNPLHLSSAILTVRRAQRWTAGCRRRE